MTDTTPELRKKQLEVIFSMTPQQRFMEGILMTEYIYRVVENSIKALHPGLSENSLKAEVFKRFYKNDFSPEALNKIILRLSK